MLGNGIFSRRQLPVKYLIKTWHRFAGHQSSK
uniref:Uncharacterized protein n=1 Tax=Anguilla anguilla TaxID=7936 RepID=A0A0E9RWV1_ANGAN